ncbi:MAG: hypothetical protein FJ088_09595, partial [Deltaproteobacteria bacterium]|nr:hypothetical protein [Deltaproteobacteria bacterium]
NFDLFILQWFSLIPLLFALNGRGFWGCFISGLAAGAAANFGGFFWVKGLLMDFGHMGEEPALALTAVLSLYHGLVFAVSSGIYGAFRVRHPKAPPFLVFPFLFTAAEFLTPFIFPWYFANGQYKFLAVSQIADLTGPAGVTFLILCINTALYEVIDGFIACRRVRLFPLIGAIALFIGALSYGVHRIGEIDGIVSSGEKMKIGLVEADVGIWEKEARDETGAPLPPAEMIRMLFGNLIKHQKLSQKLENEGVDLIVWPESSYIPVSDIMIKRTSHFAAALTEEALFLDDDGKFAMSKEFRNNPGMKAVSAASENFIVAAGKEGTVYVLANGEWKRELTGHDRDLHAVRAFDNGEISAIAAGEAGIVMFRTPKGWVEMESGTNRHLNAVICSSPDRCLFGGESGVIALFDGSGFRLVKHGFTEAILGGAATAGGKFILIGENGLFLVYDGERIERVETGTNADLYAAAAYGDTVLAAGGGGAVLKYSDGKIHRVNVKIKADVRSAAVISDGRIVLGASDGAVYVKDAAGGEGFVREHIAGHKAILSISDIGYTRDFPVPKDAKYIYKSLAPLPEKEDEDANLARSDRNAALRGFSTPLLMGVITYEEAEGERRYFNTAMLADQNGKVLGMYDKG